MNRVEYMAQLSYLLQDLPEMEKQDVLDFYEDYFEEGGPDQEELIIRTLGSPERLAAMIKDGMGNGDGVYGEYTESGYRDVRFREDGEVPQNYHRTFKEQKESGHILVDKERNRRNGILLAIILVVFLIVIGPKLPGFIFIVVCIWFLKYYRDQRYKEHMSKDNKNKEK